MSKKASHLIKFLLIGLCFVLLFFHFTKKPYFSVIICSYNYGHFLPKTVESVLESTFNSYEIIIVNDGSTDNTSEILKRYKNHPKITIIEHENMGLSLSRNKAMKLAKGKYFWFVDADDWIDRRALERLYKKTRNKNIDMVSFYTAGMNADGSFGGIGGYDRLPIRLELGSSNIYTIDDFEAHEILQYPVTSGKQIYKSSFIKKNNIEFPPKTIFEDDVFFLTSIFADAKISSIPTVLYYKRGHSGAITSDRSRFYDSYLRICRYIWKNSHKNKKNHEKATIVSNAYISGLVGRWSWCTDELKQKFYPDLVIMKEFIDSQPDTDEYWKKTKVWFNRSNRKRS